MDFARWWWQQTGSGPNPDFVADSLRFRGGQYLYYFLPQNHESSSCTMSVWVKYAVNPGVNTVFSSYASSTASSYFLFLQDHRLQNIYTASSGKNSLAYYRDPNAWYHLVVKNDKTANKATTYVNGKESFSTPAFAYWNGTRRHSFGSRAYDFQWRFEGYMADAYFVDGQALEPEEFGEYNNDVWVPKTYAGTYGDNGFHLTFDPAQDADPAVGIGKDSSGNGNDFTSAGFETSDPLTKLYDPSFDSPTRNEALWVNKIDPFQKTTFNTAYGWPTNANAEAGGDGTATFSGSNRTTFEIPPTGTHTLEFMLNNGANAGGFAYANGFSTHEDFYAGQAHILYKTGRYYYYGNAGTTGNNAVYNAGVQLETGTGFAFAPGGIYRMKVVIDRDTQTATWYIPTTSPFAKPTSVAMTHNFGTYGEGKNFVFAMTSTGYAGNTTQTFAILNNPSIDFGLSSERLPAAPIPNGRDHFKAITNTGANILTAAQAAFPNGLWWIKSRVSDSNTNQHQLVDSVRGATNAINCPATGQSAYVKPSENSVAWCWSAPDTFTPTVTGGLQSPSGRRNVKAGFSIVKATGTNVAGSYSHGLSKPPEFIISAKLTTANIGVYHSIMGQSSTQLLQLDTSIGTSTRGYTTYNVSDGTTVQMDSFAEAAASGDYVYYNWHSVPGYSAIGYYDGNSSANGPFIYTGFRPAFVMRKISNSGNTGSWVMQDSTRSPYNPSNQLLYPDLTNSEGISGDLDFLSNGFKLRTTYWNIGRFIYVAFAENPFGGENVSPSNAR